MHHAATNAGCRAPCAGVSFPVAEAQQAGLSSRRYYDLTYILVVFLAFPLYWVKVMDWRLCEAADSLGADPWLIRPPSEAWVQSWPCKGSQASKLGYVLSSPAPFLRSLVWPMCFSELHFFTSMHFVLVGGLVMLAATRGAKYDMANKWRLLWALVARVQVRAAPILVKLLRPQTPWPVAISQSLPVEGPAGVLYSVALMGPVRHQAMGALLDLIHVTIICAMYGSAWPHAMPRPVLVVLQAACGLLTVGISAYCAPAHAAAGVVPPADGPSSPKAGLELRAAHAERPSGSDGEGALGDAPPVLAPPRMPPGAVPTPQDMPPAEAGAPEPPAGTAPSASGHVHEQRLLRLCRRLALRANAEPGRAAISISISSRSSSTASSTSDGAGEAAAPGEVAERTRRSSTALVGDGAWSCGPYEGEGEGALSWSHLQLKLPGVEPTDLAPGAEARVAEAVALSYPGAAGPNVAIRSGCIELHLDLVRGVAAATQAAAVSAMVPAAAAAVAMQGGARADDTTAAAGVLGGAQGPGPASAEQQDLASSILLALGLPPGYDAAVRAQVGEHLLTLTPAAGPGGGWAVLGTRRLQALEVPCVARVEPPAVVAPEADAAGGTAAVKLRMTISGSAERLAAAPTDADLEVLALFEGAFLELSDLRWGPMEEGGDAGGGSSPLSFALAGGGSCFTVPSRRVLTANLALPVGRSGAIGLLLMRRGTAGRSHPLLLVRAQDAALAAEVEALQARSADGSGPLPMTTTPSGGSVANFVRDLGHWLQFRDYWRRKAAAAESLRAAAATAAAVARVTASGGGGGGGGIRSSRLARRLSASWMGALLSWSRRCADGVGGGADGVGGFGGLFPQIKSQRLPPVAAAQQLPPGRRAAGALAPPGHGRNGLAPAGAAEMHGLSRSGDSDLLDQDESGCGDGGGGGGRRVRTIGDTHRPTYAPAANGHALALQAGALSGSTMAAVPAPASALEEQRRLAQGSLPACGQQAYQTHMATARRVLLEFALEQRCVAVAATLLEQEPLPQPALPPGAAGGAAAYGSASYLTELAEASRAASPDGLTLLHRAVRSGDAATVGIVLDAAARAADAAAAAAVDSMPPPQQPQLEAAPRNTKCHWHDGPACSKSLSRHSKAHAVAVVRCAEESVATPGDPGDAAAVDDNPTPRHRPRLFRLYDWSTPDAHGITPLHYAAVLDDGGSLARWVLATQPEALELWDAGSGLHDMPSPAAFAAQNGLVVDTVALRRRPSEPESERRGRDADADADGDGEGCGGGGADGGVDAAAGASADRAARPLLLAALLGFLRGDVEERYRCFAATRATSAGLPTWLLVLHLAAYAGGVMQALAHPQPHCRRGMVPLLVLQAGSVMLAHLCWHRPTGRPGPRDGACRIVAWALQAVALAVLVAKTTRPLARPWNLGCAVSHDYGAALAGPDAGDGGGSEGTLECGSAALRHGLLALHHVLAVATVPYAVVPYTLLHKVLAVQVVEAAAACCAALLRAGLAVPAAAGIMAGGLLGGEVCRGASQAASGEQGQAQGPGLGLVWAGGAAAHLAGGSLLRGAVSSVLLLAADVCARAAFVGSDGCGATRSEAPTQGPVGAQALPQKRTQERHSKLD